MQHCVAKAILLSRLSSHYACFNKIFFQFSAVMEVRVGIYLFLVSPIELEEELGNRFDS